MLNPEYQALLNAYKKNVYGEQLPTARKQLYSGLTSRGLFSSPVSVKAESDLLANAMRGVGSQYAQLGSQQAEAERQSKESELGRTFQRDLQAENLRAQQGMAAKQWGIEKDLARKAARQSTLNSILGLGTNLATFGGAKLLGLLKG